ncbi:hypothetical protein CYMTET_36897 [Cymbomonas tetramitiformis]|uniref:Uncharacterized protein n=1 Tax=Cymbomonas tetramitiformis TaxID=36881 RepID=A0AAE0CGB2_9CHLO|nr:hypothetical protein CYMTET_36897 [Cymbomonas tetramitiformis]
MVLPRAWLVRAVTAASGPSPRALTSEAAVQPPSRRHVGVPGFSYTRSVREVLNRQPKPTTLISSTTFSSAAESFTPTFSSAAESSTPSVV